MKSIRFGKVFCGAVVGLCLGAFVPVFSFAAAAKVTGNVTEIMVDDTSFGACMATLSVNVNTVLSSCFSNWVTFDCTNSFANTNADIGNSKLKQAQLAYALGKQVEVFVTDTKKINGYCLATRINVK